MSSSDIMWLLAGFVFGLALPIAAVAIHRSRVLAGVEPVAERPGALRPAVAAALLDARTHVDHAGFVATAYDLILRGRFRTVPGQTGDVVDLAVLPGNDDVYLERWEVPVEQLLLAATRDDAATLGQLNAMLCDRSGDAANTYAAFRRSLDRFLGGCSHRAIEPALWIGLALAGAATIPGAVAGTLPAACIGIGLASLVVLGTMPRWPRGFWSRAARDEARRWHAWRVYLQQLRLEDAQPAALDIEEQALADAVAFGIAATATDSMQRSLARIAVSSVQPAEVATITSQAAAGIAARSTGRPRRRFRVVEPGGASALELLLALVPAALLVPWMRWLAPGVGETTVQLAGVAVLAACLAFAESGFAQRAWRARPLSGLAARARSVGRLRYVVRDGGYLLGWTDEPESGSEPVLRIDGSLILESRGHHRIPARRSRRRWTDVHVQFVDGGTWVFSVEGHVHGDDGRPDFGADRVWFDVGRPEPGDGQQAA